MRFRLRVECLFYRSQQFFRTDGLSQRGIGAEHPRGSQGACKGTRYRDDSQPRIYLSNILNQLDSFPFRHREIGDEQVERGIFELRQRLVAVGGKLHRVARLYQHVLEEMADALVIISDQNGAARVRRGRARAQ